ncbi:HvfC/BufC family peptide modification chaperone [Bordetella trematum]|uniref:HvfC/BufC family peptide modification chaperone n=1 Tax=Bordetella trematum TaxID=123899 RepID=UPI00398A1D27
MPLHEPPVRVKAAVGELCAAIRQGTQPVYAELARASVISVLQTTFPHSSRRLGEAGVRALAARFVAEHPVARRCFHELATELLCFVRSQEQFDPAGLAWMEYEWTLLAVELDPARLASPASGRVAAQCLAVNPTLRIVSLPFALPAAQAPGPPARLHLYALYRDSRHVVRRRSLFSTDCQLLAGIARQGCIDASQWNDEAAAWLRLALRQELVHQEESFQP